VAGRVRQLMAGRHLRSPLPGRVRPVLGERLGEASG
jgi:hypothetical protein